MSHGADMCGDGGRGPGRAVLTLAGRERAGQMDSSGRPAAPGRLVHRRTVADRGASVCRHSHNSRRSGAAHSGALSSGDGRRPVMCAAAGHMRQDGAGRDMLSTAGHWGTRHAGPLNGMRACTGETRGDLSDAARGPVRTERVRRASQNRDLRKAKPGRVSWVTATGPVSPVPRRAGETGPDAPPGTTNGTDTDSMT